MQNGIILHWMPVFLCTNVQVFYSMFVFVYSAVSAAFDIIADGLYQRNILI